MREEFELKELCVGLVLTDGVRFLGVRPTGQTFYDMPKGMQDRGETLRDTVVREVEEETGLDISRYRSTLSDQGRFKYRMTKDLHVFLLQLPQLPPTSSMRCTSTFEMYGRRIPEVNGYKYFDWNDLSMFIPKMQSILKEVHRSLE